jgi:hypothetical protein
MILLLGPIVENDAAVAREILKMIEEKKSEKKSEKNESKVDPFDLRGLEF